MVFDQSPIFRQGQWEFSIDEFSPEVLPFPPNLALTLSAISAAYSINLVTVARLVLRPKIVYKYVLG